MPPSGFWQTLRYFTARSMVLLGTLMPDVAAGAEGLELRDGDAALVAAAVGV